MDKDKHLKVRLLPTLSPTDHRIQDGLCNLGKAKHGLRRSSGFSVPSAYLGASMFQFLRSIVFNRSDYSGQRRSLCCMRSKRR